MEVAHFTRVVAREPLGQPLQFRPIFGARDSAEVKIQLLGLPNHPIGARGRVCGESHKEILTQLPGRAGLRYGLAQK